MKLKITLILQIFFFAIFGGWLYFNRENFISEFWLETIPVDPRDMLSGTYVALRYKQEEAVTKCAQDKIGKNVYALWVEFGPSTKTFTLADGKKDVYYEVKNCSEKPVYSKNWAKIFISRYMDDRIDVNFPKKYYLNENDPRKSISSSLLAVKVKIQKDRTLTLVNLAPLKETAK